MNRREGRSGIAFRPLRATSPFFRAVAASTWRRRFPGPRLALEASLATWEGEGGLLAAVIPFASPARSA